jgi:hypothetical protein
MLAILNFMYNGEVNVNQGRPARPQLISKRLAGVFQLLLCTVLMGNIRGKCSGSE